MTHSELELPNDALLLALDRLHVLATAASSVLPEARMRRLLRSELSALHHTLTVHFDDEEEGRYMGAVLDRLPQADDTVRRLKAQHAEITTRMLTLAQECDAVALPALKDRAAALLDLIGEHERDEVALVERAR